MSLKIRIMPLFAVSLAAVVMAGCGGGGGGGGTTGPGTPTRPNPPTSLTATRGTVQLSQFNLAWAGSTTPGVNRYDIYRRLEGQSTFTKIAETQLTNFLDTTVPAAVAFDTIRYYVVAVNVAAGLQSNPSNEAVVPAMSGPPPPPFP